MTSQEAQRPSIKQIVTFLWSIGISVRAETINEPTFLPGIKVGGGTLIIDESRLKYPGDLLHEAGHLAVITPEKRLAGSVGQKAHEEMMAIAWSYAAAVHLDLEPSVVLHESGYQGWREVFIEGLKNGSFVGVTLLEKIGLTAERSRAAELGIEPYPHLLRWLL